MAAPLGFKTFATGDVLTAADTNGYLMQGIWTFANATARDAAVTSPQEGNTCYLKDTDNIMVYSGSAWVIKSAVASGLTLINTTSFSAVASQSFNDVFSATYDNYLVEWSCIGSTSNNIVTRMRVSGTDNTTTGDYRYAGYSTNSGTTTLSGNASGATVNYFYTGDAGTTTYSNGTMNISQPFSSSKAVTLDYEWAQWNGTNLTGQNYHGGLIVNTSYTGFTFVALSGTITGTVSIYGVAK